MADAVVMKYLQSCVAVADAVVVKYLQSCVAVADAVVNEIARRAASL